MGGTVLDGAPSEADDDFPLANLFRELIFDPRTARGTRPPPNMAPGRATSYFPKLAADPEYGLHLMRPLDLSCYAGASALLSTPTDLVRFGLRATPAPETLTFSGDLLGGNVASLQRFPKQGLAVAVLANVSYAETAAIGAQVAEAFGGRR